ncbi:zinc carboxypeptidase [Tumebacillus sp. BK434]|uniref:M14 family zinc carboxypeptidase n=1 Tax=Tumebacillus sp. BK434 TaxID=2512169 RepID=UPI00105087AD|nr:M14 family zinc carboxypeptidase [Tumebacillus sp. BK434]TCP54515.1 zinc carboxypeptidase [Tumebacillus sp. BK434]
MKKQALAGALSLTLITMTPYAVFADNPAAAWTNVNAYETQETNGSLFNQQNYDFVKYSALAQKLQTLAKQSNRVTVNVSGQSSQGRDLYTVTISDPQAKGKYGYYQALRKQMFKNPEKAQSWVEKHEDFKVPVMINGSIHGTEFVGTDAVLQLIERFALQNDATTKEILANNILIFNVVANPDGRYDGTRFNGNGIDLNRDFITQSQPETKQTVDLITEWNPMVFLDLHGYVKNSSSQLGLIEPCTPPHNPNYEYDLFSKWSVAQAEAMEAEILSNKKQYSANYQDLASVYIPQRDDSFGWDDYPPIFTPMYALYHGSYGYTLEAPTNDWDGVRWQYDAVIGALKYATQNKKAMLTDQIEVFKRGINFDHPFHQQGFFPNAYLLPVNAADPTVTEKAVNHLLQNDITVEQAKKAFTANGKQYPAGTYIVPMDQAKAGLANTMLWDGEDISADTPAMYDISAWSLPELWGFAADPVQAPFNVQTATVKSVHTQGALIGKGPYQIPNSSVQAVHLANELLQQGVEVKRDQAGNFYVPNSSVLLSQVKASGLTLQTAAVPSDAKLLDAVQVAIVKDGGMNKGQSHSGTKLALQRLGFAVTELHPRTVAAQGLNGFDALIYSGTERLIATTNSVANAEFGLQSAEELAKFKANVNAFVDGGGKYIAVGAGGSLAAKTLGLTSVGVNVGSSNANGIVKINYSDSPLTAGYGSNDIGFVYRPVWYTNTAGYAVDASYANEGGFFLAGHWINSKSAQGKPVIVHDPSKEVTLIGLEAGFRDHTDYLFRLLANAIYE